MRDIVILLSAAGSQTMPGQLRCFRNNKERNIKIVGVDMCEDPTVGFMVDEFYHVPPVSDEGYIDIILDICKKEKVDVYFPNISAEVTKAAERSDEFKALGTVVSIADLSAVEVLNNKLRMYETLSAAGISVPRFYAVHSLEDFEKGCSELGYPDLPVCLKLTGNSGSRGVRIIDSKRDRYEIFAHEKPNSFFISYEEMFAILRSAKKLDEMMLVEYMPGNEYTVDLLAENGKVLYIAGRENFVSMMSIAQQSVTADDTAAYDISRRTVSLLGYSGNIGFDFMRAADGTPMLMDINPRLTATVSLIAAAGINLPYLRVKQLLGEPLTEHKLLTGVRLTRRYGEYFSDPSGNEIEF
ncbi:MAG: ATP-grasp domain-containing protein [Ruminococcus sp.]|nr:ATP-grasp domain-containing protein [Ruminococcus sp.]